MTFEGFPDRFSYIKELKQYAKKRWADANTAQIVFNPFTTFHDGTSNIDKLKEMCHRLRIFYAHIVLTSEYIRNCQKLFVSPSGMAKYLDDIPTVHIKWFLNLLDLEKSTRLLQICRCKKFENHLTCIILVLTDVFTTFADSFWYFLKIKTTCAEKMRRR